MGNLFLIFAMLIMFSVIHIMRSDGGFLLTFAIGCLLFSMGMLFDALSENINYNNPRKRRRSIIDAIILIICSSVMVVTGIFLLLHTVN